MFAVAEVFDGLAVDLVGGNDPEHEAGLFLAIDGIDQVNGFDGEQGFAAASGYFEAEVGQRAFDAVFAGLVVMNMVGFFPGLGGEVDFEVGIFFGLLPPIGQEFEVLLNLVEGLDLVFF